MGVAAIQLPCIVSQVNDGTLASLIEGLTFGIPVFATSIAAFQKLLWRRSHERNHLREV